MRRLRTRLVAPLRVARSTALRDNRSQTCASSCTIPTRVGPGGGAAVADAAGHFRFPDLEPGVYRLDAQQVGFPPLLYDSNSASAKAGTITLSAGQRVKNLEIRLTPAATITGTVVNRHNRIIARASVGIEATRDEGGTRRVIHADARGRFRIGFLPPGRYRITAEPDAESAPPSSARNREWGPSGRIVTVRNRTAVAPAVVVVVEVEAGEELSDVQVLLPASRFMVGFALT